MVILSFRGLDAYKHTLESAHRVFIATLDFPSHESYRLTDQLRRSSRAVAVLIAEAWARRSYTRAFAEKLNQAMTEAMETQVWLDHAMNCGYIDAEEHRSLDDDWQRAGGMLHEMIDKAHTFRPKDTHRPR